MSSLGTMDTNVHGKRGDGATTPDNTRKPFNTKLSLWQLWQPWSKSTMSFLFLRAPIVPFLLLLLVKLRILYCCQYFHRRSLVRYPCWFRFFFVLLFLLLVPLLHAYGERSTVASMGGRELAVPCRSDQHGPPGLKTRLVSCNPRPAIQVPLFKGGGEVVPPFIYPTLITPITN